MLGINAALGAEPMRNPVLEWNDALVAALRSETNAPPLAVRNLALFHRALLNAATQEDATELLVDATAYAVAVALYPSQTATFSEVQRRALPGQPLTDAQRAVLRRGEAIAAAALETRGTDGTTSHVSYIPSDKPGAWRRTPPFFRPPELPHWVQTTPFEIAEVAALVPPPPPALASAEYARAFAEVKELGGAKSTRRTQEQTLIARFWSDFSFTSTPPGHWNDIARQISTERGLNWRETACLFAAMNTAMADTSVVMWTAKYRYNFWRPVTAIHEAKRDGNDDTAFSGDWRPLLATPPHPEYVSGHSGFSAAAAAVIRKFLGSDTVAFVARSDAVPNASRRFESLTSAVNEISDSRVYGGIHFRFSTEAGKVCGERIGTEVATRALRHRVN